MALYAKCRLRIKFRASSKYRSKKLKADFFSNGVDTTAANGKSGPIGTEIEIYI